MPVIPMKVYQNVEWHLHNRERIVAEAEKQRDEAALEVLTSTSAPQKMTTPRGVSKHADPTPLKAIQLERLETLVIQARIWVSVIEETFSFYYGTNVEDMARAFYGQNVKLAEIAKLSGIDRRIVSSLRDKFVCTCALYAAARGLITIGRDCKK